ncbi:MAG: hypothetical protein ACOYYS_19785 [Chloroflexota bacterium]
MSLAQHERAVKLAEKAGDRLGRLFGRLGTTEHPRGRITAAYRVARRVLATLKRTPQTGRLMVIDGAFSSLQGAVEAAARESLLAARDLGIEHAASTLAVYGIGLPDLPQYPAAERLGIEHATNASVNVLANVERQRRAAMTIVQSGGDLSLLLGDDGRAGMVTPGPVLRDAANWLAWSMAVALSISVEAGIANSGARLDFRQQAIAAIDQKTTNCCLKVHGQVAKLNEDFTLTGTPRFADKLPGPPFHWWCRTATALVLAEDANDALTRQMREAALEELQAQEISGKKTIWPSHARSGRR